MEKEEIIEIFCNNVRMLRMEHHLTKKEMARIMGIGVQSLSKIENGILPPRMSGNVLFRLHRYFGVYGCAEIKWSDRK